MVDAHRFDTLSKALVADSSRRALLGAAAAALARGPAPIATAAKKRKGKKKRKRRGSCSGGACVQVPEWAGNRREIAFCEFVCRQCDGDDPREFCVVDTFTPDGTPTKKADCCDEGKQCCGGLCCGSSTNPGVRCCGQDCVDTRINADHCNGCNQPCPTGASCVGGACVDSDGDDGCVYPQTPDPCRHLSEPGGCVVDQNTVCCDDFRCIVPGNPADYSCCGRAAEHPTYGCLRADETCLAGDKYPPLATHCRRGDPACGS